MRPQRARRPFPYKSGPIGEPWQLSQGAPSLRCGGEGCSPAPIGRPMRGRGHAGCRTEKVERSNKKQVSYVLLDHVVHITQQPSWRSSKNDTNTTEDIHELISLGEAAEFRVDSPLGLWRHLFIMSRPVATHLSSSFSTYYSTSALSPPTWWKVRVRTVMENLEKSWNFKMVISRPGKVMEKT